MYTTTTNVLSSSAQIYQIIQMQILIIPPNNAKPHILKQPRTQARKPKNKPTILLLYRSVATSGPSSCPSAPARSLSVATI